MKKQKKQKKDKLLNIQLLFILVSMAEIVGTLVISTALAGLSKYLFNQVFEIPDILWMLIFSIVIGVTLAIVINIILLRPVVELSKGMKAVAAGHFDVRLRNKSGIQEMRDTYDSFNLMARELGATETLQTDFVANVSHEFKTPINAIEGYATLLHGSSDDPQQREYAAKILLNTRRLSTLVGNILLLSKVSNHAIPVARTKYRLDEQIRQAILLLEPRWTERQTDFDVDLEEITWTGPESLMHHVWSNLIGNAIKFGPENGCVRIALKAQEDAVLFTIEDDGIGIPEEEIPRIFNKFYQLDSSHKQEGNGLGLALVKQILDTCEGDIQVENLPTTGCRFTVRLSHDD